MHLRETDCEFGRCMKLAQGRVLCRSFGFSDVESVTLLRLWFAHGFKFSKLTGMFPH